MDAFFGHDLRSHLLSYVARSSRSVIQKVFKKKKKRFGTSTVSLTPPVKEITTTVTRHISSFDQYDPWILSHDKLQSLFSFMKVNSFSSE